MTEAARKTVRKLSHSTLARSCCAHPPPTQVSKSETKLLWPNVKRVSMPLFFPARVRLLYCKTHVVTTFQPGCGAPRQRMSNGLNKNHPSVAGSHNVHIFINVGPGGSPDQAHPGLVPSVLRPGLGHGHGRRHLDPQQRRHLHCAVGGPEGAHAGMSLRKRY